MKVPFLINGAEVRKTFFNWCEPYLIQEGERKKERGKRKDIEIPLSTGENYPFGVSAPQLKPWKVNTFCALPRRCAVSAANRLGF